MRATGPFCLYDTRTRARNENTVDFRFEEMPDSGSASGGYTASKAARPGAAQVARRASPARAP